MSLFERTGRSIAFTSATSLLRTLLLVVRSILLLNWLSVETFSVYATGTLVVSLTFMFADFGLNGALLHHSAETEDEEAAAATHFTLKLLFTVAWLACVVVGAGLFAPDRPNLIAIIVVAASFAVEGLTKTASTLLKRRVQHRRLALLQSCDVMTTTVVVLWLAWRGNELWAYLAISIGAAINAVFWLYVYKPVWRPRLAWDAPRNRYFLAFGRKQFAAAALQRAIDNVDDLFARVALGANPLAFYRAAYRYATYPRRIVAFPLNSVVGGTFAEAHGDRAQLSRSFVQSLGLLTRAGFFLAGLLALIAPEFIRLLITAKWLPMLTAFRLMLIYTMLDPLKATCANLFVAVGRPEIVVRARLAQLATLVVGLLALGWRWGIAGVAIAADLMLIVGIVLLLQAARQFVDFNARTIFGVPTAAMLVGLAVGRASLLLPGVLGNDWRTGTVKSALFCLAFAAVMLTFERQQTTKFVRRLRTLLPSG